MDSVIADILLTVYQNILLVYLIKKQIPQRSHSFYYEITTVLFSTVTLMSIQHLNLPLPDFLMFLFPLVFIKLTSDERWLHCILWILVDMVLTFGTLTLVSYLFDVQVSLNGNAYASSQTSLMIYSIAGTSALTIVFCIAAHIRKQSNEISRRETIIFIAMLLLCFTINECFFMTKIMEYAEQYLVIGSGSSLILMMLTMLLYEYLTKAAQQQRMAELTLQTNQLMAEHQAELKTIYTAMLAEQHDLRHRIAAAEAVLSSSSLTSEDRASVLKLLEFPEEPAIYITGNTAVDAIIKAKVAIMKNAGITFEFAEYPLLTLPIAEQDFCVLLANLMDNAIEGVMRLPASCLHRKIKLVFSKVWNMLFITCSNDADNGKVVRRGEEFISSKAHPELHGFGTKTMRRIVEDAGGTIDFDIEPRKFTVHIMLGGKSPC